MFSFYYRYTFISGHHYTDGTWRHWWCMNGRTHWCPWRVRCCRGMPREAVVNRVIFLNAYSSGGGPSVVMDSQKWLLWTQGVPTVNVVKPWQCCSFKVSCTDPVYLCYCCGQHKVTLLSIVDSHRQNLWWWRTILAIVGSHRWSLVILDWSDDP